MIGQVQAMGVVNERELITLVYIAATSRILSNPINIIVKGASSGGKSYTAEHVLDLIGPDYVARLTSSSALALVYDNRPLAHRVISLFEASQLQASEKQGNADSTLAMLLRSLMSEGKLVHQASVEDPIDNLVGASNGLYVKVQSRSSSPRPLGSRRNETRMLGVVIHEDHDQTSAVIHGIATGATGTVIPSSDLAVWHDLQRWLALGRTKHRSLRAADRGGN